VCFCSYNAIHDPSINMVSAAVIVEGALDVLSAATLMQLAENSLPIYVNNAIVLFCLLELVNAGQCFALPCLLSGGHDDTPKDLVKYNAYLRCARGFIDLGTIVLRVVLWVQYDAVSSVFLVKNLYNLIHTATQVDRYSGVRYYPDVSVCCTCRFCSCFYCCFYFIFIVFIDLVVINGTTSYSLLVPNFYVYNVAYFVVVSFLFTSLSF